MQNEIIIKPKFPASPDWWLLDRVRVYRGFPAERYVSKYGHVAISAVETPEQEHEQMGPEYHVSISKNGARVSADEIPELLRIFDMLGADEDNHAAGIARHFWLPVADKYAGYVCPCKETEHAITEGDYVWRPLAE